MRWSRSFAEKYQLKPGYPKQKHDMIQIFSPMGSVTLTRYVREELSSTLLIFFQWTFSIPSKTFSSSTHWPWP